ncbi:signal peptidase II [Ruania suaedae]|uniref:signal peptidase II n=1 Tax=Ruania suaedae TaxID=2897774 RepID=UPI001E64ACD6|nr:signal peptidase II [Ruania suaedae]UFU04240.1 signal peptidase II [Ruania suaedae]
MTGAAPGAHQPSDAAGAVGRRPLALMAGPALAILVLDQASKQLVLGRLEEGTYQPVLGDLLGLSLVFNPGAAFSFAEGATWLFTVAAVVVTAVIVVLARRVRSRAWALVLGGLLGGNLGNLIDRLLRDPGFGVGHVVDFINYAGFFVGNVADIAIVLGAIGIAILSLRSIPLSGVPSQEAHDDADSTPTDEGRHG